MARAQVGTIRVRLLKIGGHIKITVRRIVIALSSAFPLQHVFEQALVNLRRRSPPPG